MYYPTKFFRSPSNREVEQREVFYHPELDVLRFVAFLAVFVHHALPREAGLYIAGGLSPTAAEWLLAIKEAGAFGLDLFFALSAYLITELLLREHAKRGKFSISAFYVRRALRIWPLYFTFLAATVIVMPLIFPKESFGPIYIASFALFSGNWACAFNGIPFSVASPLWSVSVEEQFYLAWPLLLLLVGVNRIKQLALALIVMAFATRIFLAAYGVEHPGVWCNTLARLDPIALGALLAFALGGRAPQIKNAHRLLLGVVAAVSFLLGAKYLSQDGPTSVFLYPVTALASVTLLIAVLQNDARFLQLPPFSWLVYLGRISYGLYVFHLFALAFITQHFVSLFGIPLSFELRFLSALLLTVILAAASYKWLEQPFLRLKKRFTYAPARDAVVVSSPERDVEPRIADLARVGS